ncbi:DUF7660 family protein [Bacillus thuringiensis]|uniref:DUF7660 family protein n=1 Tax=Bacillus thuringiensis TaxID=1428 RepID=UPI0005A7C73B|nr:hypothetical protein [Bacillus thuringiensis]QKH33230.1 hypothetical protein FOC87_10215 [Bacillus thuringiensis]QKQ42946.1 hypothetical protein FOC85_18440 [Bacillus thuringiensis]HDR8035118.1 hypothetical protein [Bacillus cereus]
MYDLAYGVDSKEKLVEFLFYLQKDFKENQEDWENITLADYLESMEAWLNDCDGVFQNKDEEMPKDISWNFLAMVLLAGSFYE